jgi:uncharacterized membrane protein
METRVPARLTAAEGRKFGVTVGLAFVVLGSIAMWRGKQRTAVVMMALGGLLVAAGLIAPTSLGPVERGWMKIAHLISKVTTPIFMGVVYFLVLTPTGFIRRLTGGGAMARRAQPSTRWEEHAVADPSRMERQF